VLTVPTLTRRGYYLLRSARRAALRAVSPLDHLVNRLNGKTPFPPVDMRREVGGLSTFENAAGEVMAALELLAAFTPTSRVLDVGCGCGALPLVMRRRVTAPFRGSYIGLDVDPRLTGWCAEHLADDHFRFARYDYHNASYNPEGSRFLPFPVADGWADVVVMKSVITHMLPADVAFYMAELARVLAPQGRALVTAYLFGARDTETQTAFPHVGEGGRFRYAKPASPESAIALSEDWFLPVLEDAGLAWELHPGAQRLVVLRHAAGS
jgi:SAM-dependent methyltransferase